MMNRLQLARRIDHTVLKPESVESDIRAAVAAALEYRFAAVCVNARWLGQVRTMLDAGQRNRIAAADTRVAACAVVGFPFGTQDSSVKAFEAVQCAKAGADEIDMVIWIPALLSGDIDAARTDVREVAAAVKTAVPHVLLKVILETAVLTESQIAMGCRAAMEGGADFVKTSTGFHPAGGATVQAVRWLKQYCGNLRVKAAGGIRDLAAAQAMLQAGADRIGCSTSVAILNQVPQE
ncbi:MAG: deoxyribose-phosphate aldolase [Phycisphaerae bacterium]